MHPNRRAFLGLSLTAAAAWVAGCQPAEPPAPLEPAAGAAKTVLFAEGMH